MVVKKPPARARSSGATVDIQRDTSSLVASAG
jgi:hypothetical protein